MVARLPPRHRGASLPLPQPLRAVLNYGRSRCPGHSVPVPALPRPASQQQPPAPSAHCRPHPGLNIRDSSLGASPRPWKRKRAQRMGSAIQTLNPGRACLALVPGRGGGGRFCGDRTCQKSLVQGELWARDLGPPLTASVSFIFLSLSFLTCQLGLLPNLSHGWAGGPKKTTKERKRCQLGQKALQILDGISIKMKQALSKKIHGWSALRPPLPHPNIIQPPTPHPQTEAYCAISLSFLEPPKAPLQVIQAAFPNREAKARSGKARGLPTPCWAQRSRHRHCQRPLTNSLGSCGAIIKNRQGSGECGAESGSWGLSKPQGSSEVS